IAEVAVERGAGGTGLVEVEIPAGGGGKAAPCLAGLGACQLGALGERPLRLGAQPLRVRRWGGHQRRQEQRDQRGVHGPSSRVTINWRALATRSLPGAGTPAGAKRAASQARMKSAAWSASLAVLACRRSCSATSAGVGSAAGTSNR